MVFFGSFSKNGNMNLISWGHDGSHGGMELQVSQGTSVDSRLCYDP